VLVGALAAVAYFVLAGSVARPLMANAQQAARRGEYSEDTAKRHLSRVYRCLWRIAGPGAVNGFPATEEELRALGSDCWDPAIAPGGGEYGTAYEFRYRPGPRHAGGRIRSFGIATKRRSDRRSYTDSYYLDEQGLLRHSRSGWATAEASLARNGDLEELPALVGLLDAYRLLRGRPPARLLPYRPYDNLTIGPNDLVIPEGIGPPVHELLDAPEGTTRLRSYSSVLEYAPQPATAASTTPTYTLAVRRQHRDVHTKRSYFVDVDGGIHATGEPRDATANDPLAVPDEFRFERRSQVRDEFVRQWRASTGANP
jgi:hypothetical protein